MNKRIFFSLICLSISSLCFAQTKAKDIAEQAVRKGSVSQSISYLQDQIKACTANSEKRSLYIFLGSIQEQMAMYDDAQKSYATAAGISAADAEGMPKKTNEQLVLDAVRCSLCTGDSDTADKYLNSSVRNTKNAQVSAYVKLYTQWSALCKAEKTSDLQEPLELLKAYLKVENMKSIQPVILLTLWYVTGEESYSKQIISNFPKSTEAAIVKGDVQLLPVPFWYFVPKSGVAEQGTGSITVTETVSSSTTTSTKTKFTKWQLGLFKTEANAKMLCEELKTKGFSSYVTSEKRASGTTYYIVLVNETAEGNIADRLRSAGYDCYPVE
ncbi:MAG: SPOR domain-containing protein [Treponema sp.]|nr:SPOR domain-containing protein [Treponema sp.]